MAHLCNPLEVRRTNHCSVLCAVILAVEGLSKFNVAAPCSLVCHQGFHPPCAQEKGTWGPSIPSSRSCTVSLMCPCFDVVHNSEGAPSEIDFGHRLLPHDCTPLPDLHNRPQGLSQGVQRDKDKPNNSLFRTHPNICLPHLWRPMICVVPWLTAITEAKRAKKQ